MENVGTCVWWIRVRVKSTMYSLSVAMESVAVKDSGSYILKNQLFALKYTLKCSLIKIN